MAHDHDHDHKHDHDHSHNHDHHHGDGHHHHHHGDHQHDWHSQDYVSGWIARDVERSTNRQPIIDRLIAAVPYGRDSAITVLDVGGGSGVLTDAVLKAFPRAQVTLQDFSQPMLDSARGRFADRAGQVRYVLGDLRDPVWAQSVGGPFDLAVSGIAIHNLHDLAVIAGCYEAVHGRLKSGGCFLDYDHFDRAGGVPLHQHSLKVAGFRSVDLVWHEHPTAILKANV
jgi:2-polyprenyl-3-methyl-5-hydroxy-6-metoxy-1,4-benzoquinol methylase